MEEKCRRNKIPETAFIKLVPDRASMAQVTAFLDARLKKLKIPMKTASKLMTALDEIYSNIVHYSGASYVEVKCEICEGVLTLTFRDNGKPYNPLEAKEPDITLPAEERAIGGLGIFMVRKLMDSVDYTYKDGSNVLILKLAWEK